MQIGRLAITDVSPAVACGRWPARAVVGETLTISATVFREGHDAIAATVVLTGPDGGEGRVRMQRAGHQPDHYEASVHIDSPGTWTYLIEAWSDPVGTWQHAVEVKEAAGQGDEELALDLEEGARLLERAVVGVPKNRTTALRDAAARLRDKALTLPERTALALHPATTGLLHEHPLRELVTPSDTYRLWVDRERALFGAWYEFFPRSEGASMPPDGGPVRSGTFRTAMERLPAVAAMGFDVVYLPPIHPIGQVNRKGPNNTLTPGPHDPGSPWAIGSEHGGHDAIHPDLGTLEDFDAFAARAAELGMEVALDLALQCAPDHPWAKAHPEWFTVRADGSIAYAENPPKKYQDIYPLNFDPPGPTKGRSTTAKPRKAPPKAAPIPPLYAEVLRVVRHWTSHGVRIFRVDNPHTKPLSFWEWLIAEVKATEPDVLFLAEAFTRPPMMHMLARIGFTQSYTYFTWRTGKAELQEYLTELSGPAADYMRPNFFVNTPDILHASLQYGGRPYFKVRAVLAALLSPTYGVYAGFELFEHQAVRPGSEEYLDSEKYQYRPRDWSNPQDSLAPYLTGLNRLRREHPALHWLRNLTFHAVDQPQIMCWSKTTGSDTVIVVVNLDPYTVREATVSLSMPALGLGWGDRFRVSDQVTGESYEWGQAAYVRLDPFVEPAHILVLERSGQAGA